MLSLATPINVKPGDYVLLKNWVRKGSVVHWEGPYQVLLMTPTAVKEEGRNPWVHLHHCKGISEGVGC